jgi:hypothetical protein
MIHLESRRKKLTSLRVRHPDALIVDVTSRGPEPWLRFSPFFPHGGIPVPFSGGTTAESVEGIWQGLKVFEREGVDLGKLALASMRGIKRSVRSRGNVKGHQRGTRDSRLLDYYAARLEIYLPSYRWVLDNRLQKDLAALKSEVARRPVVLLDYEINADVKDLSRPLSHATLIKAYLEEQWPG